ncbi:hypothetical protein [Streptomyces sp. NPDC006334]|uniref:hypothetical protein n=1 Tax=Streptomyces sp. NPDC006334 TaxID=3156754 RepID=UPI0033A59E7F
MTAIDERLVHDTAQRHGIPNTVAAELLAHSCPCVYLLPLEDLSPAQQKTARPAARTGGLPLLPDDADRHHGMEPVAGQVVDPDAYTLNLITGTRQDIAARRYTALTYTQQC